MEGDNKREPLCIVALLICEYDELIAELRIPLIDQELYESAFLGQLRAYANERVRATTEVSSEVKERDAQMRPLVGALGVVVNAFRIHQKLTIEVLRCVKGREEVLAALIACSNFYDKGCCSIDDAQHAYLTRLGEYQIHTLLVVEALFRWREELSRPFPFHLWQGDNYLLRVLEDSAAVANCALGKSLNLRLLQYPCCSNMDLPRILRRHALMRKTRLISTGAVWERGLNLVVPPVGIPRQSAASDVPADLHRPHHGGRQQERRAKPAQQVALKHARIVAAEQFILQEKAVQTKVVDELLAMARNANRFVPILCAYEFIVLPAAIASDGSLTMEKTMWTDMLDCDRCSEHARVVIGLTYAGEEWASMSAKYTATVKARGMYDPLHHSHDSSSSSDSSHTTGDQDSNGVGQGSRSSNKGKQGGLVTLPADELTAAPGGSAISVSVKSSSCMSAGGRDSKPVTYSSSPSCVVSDEGDEDHSGTTKELSKEESLEQLRHQLLEERRLSLSRSAGTTVLDKKQDKDMVAASPAPSTSVEPFTSESKGSKCASFQKAISHSSPASSSLSAVKLPHSRKSQSGDGGSMKSNSNSSNSFERYSSDFDSSDD